MIDIIKKHESNIKFFHINAENIIRKRTQIKNLKQDYGLSAIFALSEMWLNKNDDSLPWNVLNETHIMFRNDRNSDNKKGGGVAIYVPKILAPKEIINYPESTSDTYA